ncbi:nucleotidyl transferase AbiEii/AbiGii toxin family protein [Undibacterium sp. WLX3042]|uniref:nucleotidyl transferase AbiEii/AbiGii toxin family protein n=1 Tax=Undibacterium sp. WLX3042 TaxID=3412686 RepID=UPI003C2B40C4
MSPHADQFLLKGALLFDLWFDIPHRPTRDADFLGFGSAELPHLEAVFKDVCAMETDDGVTFRPDTVQAAEIRKEANYAGVRVTLHGLIVMRRSVVEAVLKETTDLNNFADWLLTLLVAKRGGVLYLPIVGRHWRQHPQQSHRTGDPEAVRRIRQASNLWR